MKSYFITTVAAFLTLFLAVSAQDALLNDYTILDVPGAHSTYAYDIDGRNTVGYYVDDNFDRHGFSYDGSTYTTLDVPGAIQTTVYGIDGSNIVGSYTDDSGNHGFIATIPEPAMLTLAAIGTLLACGRQRRHQQ